MLQYSFEKLQGLQGILKEEFLSDAVFAEAFELESGKDVSRAYITKEDLDLHDTGRTGRLFRNGLLKRWMSLKPFFRSIEISWYNKKIRLQGLEPNFIYSLLLKG